MIRISPKALPTLLIAIQVVASVVYGVNKDWRHCVYWIAAAVITASVTY